MNRRPDFVSLGRCLATLIFAALAFASMASGQSVITGTITGTVADSSGAVITGAQVQVVSEATGFVTPATSNEAGLYTARFLNPGIYDITITAKGFAPKEETGVELLPTAIKEVDFKLSPGSVNTTVQVTANQEMLQSGTANVETNLMSEIIENSPNIGDNPYLLATRVPGDYSNQTQGSEMATWIPIANTFSGSFNGFGRSEVSIDGTTNLGGAGAGFNPPVGSLQELTVTSSSYDAQQGRGNGGDIAAVIKSGTQQLHAQGYMVNGNTDFNANSWQRNHGSPTLTPLPRSPVNFTQQGFSVTGPVRIPFLMHSNHRTFFMFAYEHSYDYRVGGNFGANYFSVPTVKERNGDFSELGAVSGTANGGNAIFDPTTTVIGSAQPSWCAGNPAANGQPAGCFPGERESFTQEYTEGPGNPSLCNGDTNCIPKSRWNPAGAIFTGAASPAGYKQSIWPLPNVTSSTPATPYANNYLPLDYGTAIHYHALTARVDHEFNDNNKMHVSFNRSAVNNVANADAGYPDDEIGSAWVPQLQAWSVGIIDYTRIINPTEVLNLHVGGSYHPFHLIRGGEFLNTTAFGITGSLPVTLQNFPGMSFSGNGPGYTSLQVGQGQNNYPSYIEGTALFSKALARHNLKAGFQLLHNVSDGTGNTSILGTFSSSVAFTQENAGATANKTTGYGDGLASMLLGYPTGNGSTTIVPDPSYVYNYWAAFVQDDWRATSRLTMNLGLRWDYESPDKERNNKEALGFDFTDPNPFCIPNAAGTAIASCTPPPTTSTAAPQGYLGGLVYQSPNYSLPFSRDLWDRWQPRIGAALRLTSKDVIRGGFGVEMDNNPATQPSTGYSATTGFNASTNNNYTPPSCTAAQGGDAYGYCTLTNPFPNGVVLPTGNMLGLSTGLGGSLSLTDRHRLLPRTMMYSVDIQHQFRGQMLVDVTYHGANTAGIGISRNINFLPACYYLGGGCPGAGVNSILNGSVPNPMAGYMPASSSLNSATTVQQNLYLPYPEFGSITLNQSQLGGHRIGNFNYQALYGEVTKRTTHGLTFHAAATFSKVMDTQAWINVQDAQPGHYMDQQPNRFLEFDAVYVTPAFSSAPRLVREAIGTWNWNNSLNWQNGTGIGWIGSEWPTGASPKAVHQTLSAPNHHGSSSTVSESNSHWWNTCYIPLSPGVSGATVSGTTYIPPTWGPAQGPGPVGTPCNAGEQPAYKQMPLLSLNTVSGSAEMSNGIRYPIGPYWNTGLGKTFPIYEKLTFEFRADIFNPLNYNILLGSIQGGLTNSGFGQQTGDTQYNDPRFMRLRGVFSF
jgi:hypothetical protein